MNTMDAVFRHDAVIIPDVKTNHRMIDAVARADTGDDDPISAGPEL
jgi:hypothetical protein